MGCLKSLIGLLLVAVLAVFVFLNRDRISETWRGLRGAEVTAEPVPTQELADGAAHKLTQLRSGETGAVALSELELQSLLVYKYRQLLPAFVDSPRVQLEDGKIEVQARVPVERLPQLNELGEAAAFLPDTGRDRLDSAAARRSYRAGRGPGPRRPHPAAETPGARRAAPAGPQG
jgi:hypothetical protein